MKTLYRAIKITAGVFLLALLATSCMPDQETIGTTGKTFIKYTPGVQFSLVAIDAKTTPQSFILVNVKRDLPNATSLNATSVVTLTLDTDTTMIKKYNQKNGTTFIPMPVALYNTTPALASNKIVYTFNPGEFDKELKVTIPNASLFDFSKKYMICFKMTMTGEGTITQAVSDTIYRQVMAKNKYDGLYLLKGLHNRTPYNYPYETEMQLRTTGATSVAFWWPDVAGPGHPIGTADGISWYGSGIAPVIVFDGATDLITNVYNAGGATPITMFPTGSGSNSCLYDAATKTVYVSWNYNANPLRVFTDTLTYISPR